MPRTNRPPSYRLHKARNCAVVTISGKAHYLGPYGSPESHEKYARLIAEWQVSRAEQRPPSIRNADDRPITVNELILAFWHHVKKRYVKNGAPTSEQRSYRTALRPVRRLYGGMPAHAITRACERAGVPSWAPSQLRHNAATRIRAAYGIEAARIILGHSSAATSEVYAEADEERAREIMGKIG